MADGFDLLFDLVPLSGYRNLKSLGFSQAATTASARAVAPCAAFHPVAGDDCIFGAGFDSAFAHQFDLGLGVVLEAVDGHNHRDAEALGILDVGLQVAQTGFKQFQVLFGVFRGQRCAGLDSRVRRRAS